MINYTKEKQIYFFYQNCFQQYFKNIYINLGNLYLGAAIQKLYGFRNPKMGNMRINF